MDLKWLQLEYENQNAPYRKENSRLMDLMNVCPTEINITIRECQIHQNIFRDIKLCHICKKHLGVYQRR